ncbi:hypothetical protein ABZ820_41680 [Streptomyces diacarni]|uniref:hypothetical protein n=1 Tax=Streptomyces diacarni TaxID=2800381 RepID=UPI003409ABD2
MSVMTIRVSRDAGRTWRRRRTVRRKLGQPPPATSLLAPCECPRCRKGPRRAS